MQRQNDRAIFHSYYWPLAEVQEFEEGFRGHSRRVHAAGQRQNPSAAACDFFVLIVVVQEVAAQVLEGRIPSQYDTEDAINKLRDRCEHPFSETTLQNVFSFWLRREGMSVIRSHDASTNELVLSCLICAQC